MDRKGISPLIAAVLLIAFTIAVAGLAGPYLTEITQKAQGNTVNKSQTIVDSTDARLEVISTSYNSSNSSYEVTIRNSGTESVQDFTATIYGDKPNQKQINKKLEAGEAHTFDIKEAGNSTSIEVEARDLPVKTDYELSGEDSSSGGGNGGSSTISVSLSSGTFNGTTNYKPGNDNLSIGYRNGSSGDNLIGFWRLDSESGSAIDYSSEGNDGSVSISNGDRGRQGVFDTSSYFFGGGTDQIDIGSSPSSLGNGNANLTIAFWMKADSRPSSGESMISKRDGASDDGYLVYMSPDGLTFWYNGNYARDSTDDYTTSDWVFVTVVFDKSTGELRIYKNGAPATSASTSALNSDDGTLKVGDENTQDAYTFNMDELRMYDVVLDSPQISELYRYGSTYTGDYNSSEIDPSGSDHNWQNLEVDAFIPTETDLSANFSALDSSGNLVEDQIITIDTNGTKKYSVSVSNSDKAIVNFNGTTSNVTKTWQISEAKIHYK